MEAGEEMEGKENAEAMVTDRAPYDNQKYADVEWKPNLSG